MCIYSWTLRNVAVEMADNSRARRTRYLFIIVFKVTLLKMQVESIRMAIGTITS